jgi:hypothetical protein
MRGAAISTDQIMSDEDIKDPATYVVRDRGHFWWAEDLPPDRHHLPLSAVAGELRITREGRITVELDGLLAHRPDDPFQTGSWAEYDALRSRRIRGVLRDTGQGVLLFDLARASARHSSHTISVEGFSAAQCVISERQFDDQMNQPKFSWLDAGLKGFEEWLWTRALQIKHGKTLSTAKYRRPKRVTYSLKNGRLQIVQHLTGRSRGHTDLTWSEVASIRFTPKTTVDIEAVIDWHRWLQDLMILLTDTDYGLEWPRVRWLKHDCTLYFQRLVTNAERPRLHECPANFPKIKDTFGTLYESWLSVREKYGPAVYLYLGTRRGVQLYTETEYLMLISGLEAFHRTKYGDHKSRRASAKLDKIVSQIADEKDRDWVGDRLAYTTLPNLEKRIFDILEALPLGFEKSRLRTFAHECAKLRNELAHGGHRDKGTKYSDFITAVMKKNYALAPLYHALILVEIGLDPDTVRGWATDSPPAFRRNWYFAEAGLADHVDPHIRGQGAGTKEASP